MAAASATVTHAVNWYPFRAMVTIKRVSSELSPSALRKWEMYCVRFPSSTKVLPHTACSNSSLVTRRLGFRTRKSRTSKALGVRETGESTRDSVRLPGSSTNCPKRYKPLIRNWLAYRPFRVFHLFSEFPEGLPKASPLRICRIVSLDSLMASAFGHEMSDGQELRLFAGLYVHGATQRRPPLEAQLQFTLNVIPAFTWYAAPSGALTFVNQRCAEYLGLPKDHPLRSGIDMGSEWDSHISFLHPEDHE